MNRKQKVNISIVVTLSLTIASWLLVAAPPTSSLGHFVTDYEDILFPFAYLAACIVGHALDLVRLIGIMQFPLYSILIERAWLRARVRPVAMWVCGVHSALALLWRGMTWLEHLHY